MAKDPTFSAAGRVGAHVTHSRHDGRDLTAVARARRWQQFIAQARAEATARGVTLSDAEAERRAHHLQQAHMARMQLAAAQAAKARAKRRTPRRRDGEAA